MFDIPVDQVLYEAEEEISVLLNITRNINSFLFDNRNVELSTADIVFASETFQENVGLNLTEVQMRGIISLYPHARIKLAYYGEDTETVDCLLDAFAHFFLGCQWPTYGDDVSPNVFRQAMHARMRAMKFINN